MSMRALAISAAAATLLLPASSAVAAASQRGGDELPGRYIVVYENSVASPVAETERRERDDGFESEHIYNRAVKGFSARLSEGKRRKLERDPEVAFVASDRRVRASALTPLAAGEPTPPTGVRRMAAATTTTAHEASGGAVAVIDTGVDLGHPDLNAVSGTNCIGAGSAQDDHGHGTHVAGSIGGRNNGAGVVGVAPGTKVYAVKVLDGAGSGTVSSVICGIDWVTANAAALGIEVANMSLGGSGPPLAACATTTDAEHRAICRSVAAGVTYVAAAGNSAWDFDLASEPDTPAAYPEVLTVTAASDSDGAAGGAGGAPACRTTEADDRYASFSNYALTAGGAAHTIAAPGVCIRSTWLSGAYNTISGTSMATPHVTGHVALCHDEGGVSGPCAGLTPAGVIARMRADAQARTIADGVYGFVGDPTRPAGSRYFGYLDWAGGAASGPPPVDTVPPTVSATSPAQGATGVAVTAPVSVTFSEPMNQTATQQAFSLRLGGTGTPVPGSFAWNGNTMTFRPAAALAGGTQYTATVTTAARDVALNPNQLAADKAWSFTTIRSLAAAPGATTIQTGALAGGSFADLGADDTQTYRVNSTTSSTYTSAWYGTFTGVSTALSNLRVTYKGSNTRSCTQQVFVFRWSDSSWVRIDSRSVGTAEIGVTLAPAGAPSGFVSSSGGLRVRVRCQTTVGTFTARANHLRVSYEAP